MQKSFFIFFYSLVRMSFDLQDKFFRGKFIRKTNSLFEKFLELGKEDNDRVAQSRISGKSLLGAINEINELIEILVYLKIVNLSPALSVQKKLLDLKSGVLDFIAAKKDKSEAMQLGCSDFGADVSLSGQIVKPKKAAAVDKSIPKGRGLEDKIIEIIKNRGEARLKDIAEVLKGNTSPRTLNRYIGRMLVEGIISKTKKDGFTKYFIN